MPINTKSRHTHSHRRSTIDTQTLWTLTFLSFFKDFYIIYIYLSIYLSIEAKVKFNIAVSA